MPPKPIGTVVYHVLLLASNVVAADVAVGENVITASGVAAPNAELNTLPWLTNRVAPWVPRPLTLRTLLSHSVEPAAIAVPLKFETMLLTVGVIRSSSTSSRGRPRSVAGLRRDRRDERRRKSGNANI